MTNRANNSLGFPAQNEPPMQEVFLVNTSIHKANLEEIKSIMQAGTKEIEDIFQAQMVNMKKIHMDAKNTLIALGVLKNKVSPEIFLELIESWEMTESILQRTDSVIKEMYGFVRALQCEDRMTQMIDGIINNMNKDIEKAVAMGISVDEETERRIKISLIESYTIQAQRDFAMGDAAAFSRAYAQIEEDDSCKEDFTLF